jgi:hypothetical protein
MEPTDMAVGLGRGRIAIGVISLLAPRLVGRVITGAEPSGGGTSALVDGLDAAACLLARDHIRTSLLPGVTGLAASGALLSAWLSRQLDSD